MMTGSIRQPVREILPMSIVRGINPTRTEVANIRRPNGPVSTRTSTVMKQRIALLRSWVSILSVSLLIIFPTAMVMW